MDIEELELTLTFKEDGSNIVTVILTHDEPTVDLDRVPGIVAKALEQITIEHRLHYPETTDVILKFQCVDFLDQKDQEPPDLNNLEEEN